MISGYRRCSSAWIISSRFSHVFTLIWDGTLGNYPAAVECLIHIMDRYAIHLDSIFESVPDAVGALEMQVAAQGADLLCVRCSV